MNVELIHYTPLRICSHAIRQCWDSHALSDSDADTIGERDKLLIERVGNKDKHGSVLEFLTYTFEIQDISTSCLLELTRHRHASYAVRSSRYTLKKSKLAYQKSRSKLVNGLIWATLACIKILIHFKISNDDLKLALPQAYCYSLDMQINARSLQNLLSLRTARGAHFHIQELARALYDKIPDDHKYIFVNNVNNK